SLRPDTVPPATAHLWPFRHVDPNPLPPRGVAAPVSLEDFKARVREWADDVGVVSIDDPAIAHERDEVLWVYPHARSLICLIGEENKPAMQSRYLPTATHELYSCEERLFALGHRTVKLLHRLAALRPAAHELYSCEERLFAMGHRPVKLLNGLGGEGLPPTIGWPQEVGQRWADKIWPLSHKLVAQPAGLGVIGLSRNFLHRRL